MRVWITALLVGIAVLIGTLVSKDPGYVLIAYGPYQLQTSVWMMLGLVIAAWFLVRLVVSIIRQALGIGQHWQEWQARRERLKARRFVLRAWSLSQIGETERANKYLATLDQNEDWRDWAKLMQGAVGADSVSSTANAEDTTLEAREWLKSEQLMSVGGFSEAFARLEALPKNRSTGERAVDIALGASDLGLLKKALGWVKKIDHLPTETQIGVHLARAGSAADDAARSAWLELLPGLHPHQDLKLLHVLQDIKAVGAREEAARALVKRWPQYGMYLIYGLLASEAPEVFDRPLKKVRSKAIDEDALRLLDAARMERVSPEASLETYQAVAGRIESRLLCQRVLVLAVALSRTDLIASAERRFS